MEGGFHEPDRFELPEIYCLKRPSRQLVGDRRSANRFKLSRPGHFRPPGPQHSTHRFLPLPLFLASLADVRIAVTSSRT
jgi:hypothetical protein